MSLMESFKEFTKALENKLVNPIHQLEADAVKAQLVFMEGVHKVINDFEERIHAIEVKVGLRETPAPAPEAPAPEAPAPEAPAPEAPAPEAPAPEAPAPAPEAPAPEAPAPAPEAPAPAPEAPAVSEEHHQE